MGYIRNMFFVWMVLSGCSLAGLSAQDVRARVDGLESDSVYMALLREEALLKNREDSIGRVIRELRASFDTDTTDRSGRSQQLLRLEEEIFNTRNRLGIVASQANAAEQEFILFNLNKRPASSSGGRVSASTDYPNLLDNPYFRENLSAEEWNQLSDSEKHREDIVSMVERFLENYGRLEEIAQVYDTVSVQSLSDELFAQYRGILERNRTLEADLNLLWVNDYNNKLYIYALLLDKLNRMGDLSMLNEESKAIRLVSPRSVQSPVFAEYPLQRYLITSYELALAKALGLKAAADSLETVRRTIDREALSLPAIRLQEKEFVRYADVTFTQPSVYNAQNPIPPIDIPAQGKYYSVTVGTFSSRQGVNIFRNAHPVAYERLRSGQWRYYIGLYRSYGDALEGARKMKEAGFRRPEVVVWNDGAYTNLASEADKTAGYYRIRIAGVGGDLSENVRYVLDRYARGKEIIRSGDTYFVGTFTDMIHAREVDEALGTISGIETEIEEVE